ncbi:MAG: OmpA family protein [Pseudanabaenaceae cyanobacterium bins.39]|nr:OmpA family protein [Pseudanabaenaceae cyanobacterium bins.39]
MSNLPTSDKTLGNHPEHAPKRLTSKVRVFMFRGALLTIGAIAGGTIGLAIALIYPDSIWQPNLDSLWHYNRQQFTLSADALFETDTAKIRPESFQLLDEVASQLPLSKGKRIRINGYVDTLSDLNALNLSYVRALVVKEYLARLRGEQNYNWLVVGYGASRPLTRGTGDKVAKSNGRIEIFVDD